MKLRMLPVLLLASVPMGARSADAPNPARQEALLYLLHQDCGACHGMQLKGGLGPALQPESLAHLSREEVAATILHGRPGTPMPPWQPFLTPKEAWWLAGRLKQGETE